MKYIKFSLVLFGFIAVIAIYSCGNKKNEKTKEDKRDTTTVTSQSKIDTITSLDSLETLDSAIYKAPNGEYYLFCSFNEQDSMQTNNNMNNMRMMIEKETNGPCDGEMFDGKDRRFSKVSLENVKIEEFDNLKQFMETLPKDDLMGRRHVPPIQTGENSRRVKEEKRNVFIKQAWYYTHSRQGDEDYHVIIGDSPNPREANFFNIEISGLPPTNSPSYTKLKEARDYFQSFFRISKCKGGYVGFAKRPIEIEFAGSIFFDQFHYKQGGKIGHDFAEGESYWEVHPVRYIKFKKP